MDFSFTEEQEAVRELAARIFSDLATPERLKEVEATDERFDRKLWGELASAGLLGIWLPESVGGSGLGFVAAGIVAEEAGQDRGGGALRGERGARRGADRRVRRRRPTAPLARAHGGRRPRAHRCSRRAGWRPLQPAHHGHASGRRLAARRHQVVRPRRHGRRRRRRLGPHRRRHRAVRRRPRRTRRVAPWPGGHQPADRGRARVVGVVVGPGEVLVDRAGRCRRAAMAARARRGRAVPVCGRGL